MSWTKKQILEFAKTIKKDKAKNVVKINNKNYSLASVTQVLCSYLLDNRKNDYPPASVTVPSNPNGDNLNTKIYKKDYLDAIKRCYTYQKNTKKAPNYVRVASKYNVKYQLFAYAVAKIVVWSFENNNKYPNYVTINSKDIEPTIPTNEVYDYFCKVFNKKPTTIDESLQLVKEHSYDYYYNDKYTNKQAINRMKDYKGINCTDACHVFFNIAKALGYTVECLHVKCSGGDGHVRLRLKHPVHTKGDWILRDPAAVISKNGKPLNYNWCVSNFTLLATNPAWFMADLNK